MKKIYIELVAIRKELQAMRSNLELKIPEDDFSIHREVEDLKERIS